VDALAAVLAATGVRGTIAATLNAADPWGLDLVDIPGAFHAVTEGAVWLCLPGQPDTRLLPGDVVLLPTGTAHVLASAPDAGRVPFDRAAAQRALAAGEELHFGRGEPQTKILCASYCQDPAITLPLLALLPDLLHIPAARASTALGITLRLLAQEIGQPAPGSAAVLNRIVDILFVQVLRTWLTASPPAPQDPSWLAALADPVAGPALAALHTQPGRDWTVASLATATGVSRATLARRFLATVGDTPAAHLTRWRMDLAAQRLRDSDDTVAAIARSVGYGSEYAFSRAFTRSRGIPPGRYRTHSRPSDGSKVATPADPTRYTGSVSSTPIPLRRSVPVRAPSTQ
jgi:AraC-like DNA-binding protein